MNDITIVTAFFDIGRGDWTPDKGLPHYLQRTNDTYFERFAEMAKLENDMVVYTSAEFEDKVKELRGDKPTQIVVIDFKTSFEELRTKVSEIQKDPKYQEIIHPSQVRNPEYWNADYVVVNLLKATFVNRAISMNMVHTDLVAWLDFGYCREPHNTVRWTYPFTRRKIHFFNIKEWQKGSYIKDIIANNDVHITGPCIVADKEMWPYLETLVYHNIQELFKNNLIDDDQTLLLMSYLAAPEMFELHPVSPDNWFIALKDYNENLS
jgi:protein YibB